MTVAELITELSKMQPDSPVIVDAGSLVWIIERVEPGDYGEVDIICTYGE